MGWYPRILHVVEHEFLPPDGEEGGSSSRLRVLNVPAPGIVPALVVFAFSWVWYAAILSAVLWIFSSTWAIGSVWASGLLALNSTYRGILKSREQVGMVAEIQRPLGRETKQGMIIAVATGVLITGTAGFVFASTTPFGATTIGIGSVPLFIGFCAIGNARDVGGKVLFLKGFDRDRHESVVPADQGE